jgi:hypothetical protein
MPVSLEPGSSTGAGNGNSTGDGNQGNSGNNGNAGAGSGNGSQNSGAGGTGTDFFAGFSPENKEFATSKGWKSAADLDKAFTSHRELEKAFSGRDPAKTQTFRLGDYAFNAPSDPLAKANYSPERAEGFKQFAQKSGIAPEAAATIHDWFVSSSVEESTKASDRAAAALNERLSKANDALTKEWGVEETPTYKRNAEVANRAIRELGLTEALTEMGALVPNSQSGKFDVANAAIVAALAKVGNAMYAEDSLFGGSSSTKNPFATGTPDENASEAGAIMTSDPDKAEALIRAAGPQAINLYQHFLAKRRK